MPGGQAAVSGGAVGWNAPKRRTRGLIERFEPREMLAYRRSGFSVEAGVCIQAQDRAGLERLLRC